jgi:hypothetical protein
VTRALNAASAIVIAGLVLLGCPPGNLPQPVPPADPVPGYEPGAGSGGAGPAPGGLADGAACTASADCASGVCEGEGCGDVPGRCAVTARACTFDLRPYCGCDGATFQASGTCPGRRYLHRGECKAAGGGSGAPGPLPAGAPCLLASECESGICEGEGCGPDAPGVCAAKSRACTRDLRSYCGCDGVTFRGSGSCPGKRFAARGACPAP